MFSTGSRVLIGVFAVALLVLALLFYFQVPIPSEFWPWGDDYSNISPLSYSFISSIAAAICAPLVWLAAAGKLQGAAAGGLNLAVTFGGCSVFAFQTLGSDSSSPRLLSAAWIFGVSSVINLMIFFVAQRVPPQDTSPMPKLVKASFAVFIVVLVVIGGALVAKQPNILPWDLTVEASVVYGWIYLGAAAYFVYALAKPYWENATGPLIGFLAYDIVLAAPFARHFGEVPPKQFLSLCVYSTVVGYSACLAVYYLFVDKSTRLFARVPSEHLLSEVSSQSLPNP